MQPLVATFVPGPSDVILGRGKKPQSHPGNVKFQQMIKTKYLLRYSKADTRTLKSQIVAEIVSIVRRNSPNGGFIKCTKGSWFEVGDHLAREKVSQSLRDELGFKYNSAAKTKRKKRAQKKHHQAPPGMTLGVHPPSPGMVSPPVVVSPSLSEKALVRPITTAPLGSLVGPAAMSGMALTEMFMRRRRPGVPPPRVPPPPSPPVYRPIARNGNKNHVAGPKVGGLPQQHRNVPSSPRPRSSRPEEDIMAASDQLPDSALLRTDPKVLNAYCTIMASIEGKGDPEDVMMMRLMLRRTLFKD